MALLVWIGTWNIGSLSGKGKVCKESRKRMIDVCCLLEVRWRVQNAGNGGHEIYVWSCEKGLEFMVWKL